MKMDWHYDKASFTTTRLLLLWLKFEETLHSVNWSVKLNIRVLALSVEGRNCMRIPDELLLVLSGLLC